MLRRKDGAEMAGKDSESEDQGLEVSVFFSLINEHENETKVKRRKSFWCVIPVNVGFRAEGPLSFSKQFLFLCNTQVEDWDKEAASA